MKKYIYAPRTARTTFTDLSLVKLVLVALLIMEVVSQYQQLTTYLLFTFKTTVHCNKFSDVSTRCNRVSVSRQTDINRQSHFVSGILWKIYDTKQASYHLNIFERVFVGDKFIRVSRSCIRYSRLPAH